MSTRNLQGKPELISLDSKPLFETLDGDVIPMEKKGGDEFDPPYPNLIGDTILLHEIEIEAAFKTQSGIIKTVEGRKKLYEVTAQGPGVPSTVPFKTGDYVEILSSRDYTYFIAFDNEKYIIMPSASVVGYYTRKGAK